jgi:hypothetical protein
MRRISTGQWLALIFVAATVVAIGVGLVIIGPPWVQREIAMDGRRSANLESLDWGIWAYRDEHGSVPQTLDELGEEWVVTQTDPETGALYEYEALGDSTYRICAVFTHPRGVEGDPRWTADFTLHKAGRHCFDRAVPADDSDD